MTQLIINGIELPETSHDKYQCYPAELGAQVDMISGRRVVELRGAVQMISWTCDYISPALWRQLAPILRAGTPMTVQYLPDDSDTLETSTFLRDSMTEPTFAFSRHGIAYWHNPAFVLREVRPH